MGFFVVVCLCSAQEIYASLNSTNIFYCGLFWKYSNLGFYIRYMIYFKLILFMVLSKGLGSFFISHRDPIGLGSNLKRHYFL